MFDETLGGGGDVGPRVLELLDEDARAPRDGEPELVAFCLECGHGLVYELPKSRHIAHGRSVDGRVAGMVQPKGELIETVARGRKPRRSVRETRHHRLRALARGEACVIQLDLEPCVASLVGQQRGRALQKVEHGSKVFTEDGGARSAPQPFASSHCEPVLVSSAQAPPGSEALARGGTRPARRARRARCRGHRASRRTARADPRARLSAVPRRQRRA